MLLDLNVRALEALIENLSGATSTKDKVRIANRIFDSLSLFEHSVEEFVEGAMGTNGGAKREPSAEKALAHDSRVGGRHFKNMKLADIGRVLLEEKGALHGKEIESLAKAGGFKSRNRSNFQSYLAVAFARAGGFQNIGKNNWRLDPDSAPADRKGQPSKNGHRATAPRATPDGLSRKAQLHQWLKQHGPATRSQVLSGSGVPAGTASSYLSVAKELFEFRDGKWHAL